IRERLRARVRLRDELLHHLLRLRPVPHRVERGERVGGRGFGLLGVGHDDFLSRLTLRIAFRTVKPFLLRCNNSRCWSYPTGMLDPANTPSTNRILSAVNRFAIAPQQRSTLRAFIMQTQATKPMPWWKEPT